MIMISSKAGQRLAKAKRRLDEIRGRGETACEELVCEYEDAADALADELIAERHHLVEGD